MNCERVKSNLPDLLFDPAALSEAAREQLDLHVEGCASCREELASLRATMNLLDGWAAPEPSPYFSTRMQARLRAAKEEAPEGFWERQRTRILFSINVPVRALGVAALGLVLVAGGGSLLYEMQQSNVPVSVQASAAVNDLQSLDSNAQVYQQLNALDADTGSDSSSN